MKKMVVVLTLAVTLFFTAFPAKQDVFGLHRSENQLSLEELNYLLQQVSRPHGVPLGVSAVLTEKVFEKCGMSSQLSPVSAYTLTGIGYYFFIPHDRPMRDLAFGLLTFAMGRYLFNSLQATTKRK